MKPAQIAVQCYSLREHLKTPAAFAASMRRVREIGYRAVQISGIGPIPAREIRAMTDAEGLTVCATHEPALDIVERPEAVIERLDTLGCTLTAYPMAHVALDSLADVELLAAGLNRAGAVLNAAGMTLMYHNHDLEFRKLAGQTLLDLLLQRTDPKLVQAELDTYWVQAGGADPVRWCEKMHGRLPLIHLKDYAVRAERGARMAALGEGNLDLPRIVAAAEQAGCQWFVVEQDEDFDGDVFAAVARSYRYLTEHIVS